MNQSQANDIIEQYTNLCNYIIQKSEDIWDIYVLANTNAYKDNGEEWFTRRYDYERLEIFEIEKPYVVFERYACGESDYMEFPLTHYFDASLYTTIYNETDRLIKIRQAAQRTKAEKENADKQEREIAQLKKLSDKYPEVINALQRDISNIS